MNVIRPRSRWALALLLAVVALLSGVARPAQARLGGVVHQIFLPMLKGAPIAAGLPIDPYRVRTGEGTYYAADGSGNCSFPATPANLMVAAINASDYATSIYCGGYVEVTGPKGTIVVRIVDKCPECAPGDLDLSQSAFAQIANVIDGRVPISWRIVTPAQSGPIRYQFKDGSNQWWTAVQIRNHRTMIFKVEYLTVNGYKNLTRVDYNYFLDASGMGPGPYTLRVTDIYGNVLTDSGIALVPNGEVAGSGQFPAVVP
jgi:expansin (peptidoglycan-binding protein)